MHPDSRYVSLLSNTYTETKKAKKCYTKTFTFDLDALMWDNFEPNNKQIKISQEAIRRPINTNYSVSSPELFSESPSLLSLSGEMPTSSIMNVLIFFAFPS